MAKPVLTAAEIAALPGLAKRHFLDPGAQRLNKSLGDATGLTKIGFHLIEVPPGCGPSAPHRHHVEEECLFVLEGTAVVTIGEESTALGPGDFVAFPAGGPTHALMNSGEGVLRCLVVGNRLDHDVVDYPEQGKRLFRNPGLPWNLVDLDQIAEPVAGAKT